MCRRSRVCRIFAYKMFSILFQNIGADAQMLRPVVGKTAVYNIRHRSCHHEEGIAVLLKQPLADEHVEHLFFIEQQHPVAVKIS